MKDLEKLRGGIDRIDEKLIKLLNQRATIGKQIGKIKQKTGAPIFLPARENKILNTIKKLNAGPLSDESLRHVFREIFSATRAVEKKMKIACLGPAGSFSHLATRRLFGSSTESILDTGIDQVFSDVEKGMADCGVVPIENTIEGAVGQTLDLFIDSPVKIFAETYIDIHLNLLSVAAGADTIKTLYTHYMPLGQCRNWIAQNLPSVRIIETSSSAEAAKKAKKNPRSAAIGAIEAGNLYGLNALARNIEERYGNQTRFLVISLQEAPESGADKTSILFSIADESGALHRILKPFAARNLNLSKIQSRPSPMREWEYVFFVDFEGHLNNPDAQWALKKIQSQTVFLKTLGSYPNGRV